MLQTLVKFSGVDKDGSLYISRAVECKKVLTDVEADDMLAKMPTKYGPIIKDATYTMLSQDPFNSYNELVSAMNEFANYFETLLEQ